MKKMVKLTSTILTAGLLITPITTLTTNFDNVAKANTNYKDYQKQVILQKHINYIDSQIYLENDVLKINKSNVINYIKNNWKEINIYTDFGSHEEFYSSIELAVTSINNKINTGYYKFNNQKGITEKYQSRIGGSYYNNTYWWGEEYLVYNASQKAELSRDLAIAASIIGTAGAMTSGFSIIAGGLGLSAGIYTAMSARVGGFWSDRLKLKIYRTGFYHTVDAI